MLVFSTIEQKNEDFGIRPPALAPLSVSPGMFIFVKKGMGKILIEKMEFYAFHGHYEEEQIVGNRFLVDLEMETDMSTPALSDELDDAVNYQAAYQLVKSEMKKKSRLLENIAHRILESLFRELPGIKNATVVIRKMNPPMGGQMRAVSVQMSKSRDK